MSPLFPLLIGIVLKLDHLIQVIGSGLLLDILQNEVFQFHFSNPERVIGVVVGFSRAVLGDY